MLHSNLAFAQEADTLSTDIAIIDKLFGFADDLVDKVSTDTWTFIPAITYAPETSLGIGGRAMKVFNLGDLASKTKTRPSSLPLTLLYTLKNQVIVSGEVDLWMDQNNSFLNSRVVLSDYPFVFSGLGNEIIEEEKYATRYLYYHLLYHKKIARGIFLGPRYEFRGDNIYQKAENGLLESGDIPGSNGQHLSGLGISMNIDTRDNIFQPRKGMYHQLSWMEFHSVFGSDFNFTQWVFDLRKYHAINEKQVIAGQAWFSFTKGTAPFQHLSLIGGSDLMRGYFEGRYRDKHAMVYQAEWRTPLYRKLNMVLFGSGGQVANQLSGFNFRQLRWAAGFGFRYKLNSEGLNLRIDLAFGDQSAFYFGLNEVI
ncbi:Outer membrane protein [Cyclobacterium qasimii M12-11B]|uniref:Outer membrane protein n=3 Tax=Cyclobacterium qasimii TaxID=1350429 RepID=S7VI97_9BACT|nr:Outer membrane protein [Cyclobacterium qasimii M12-11B]GEO21506.1 membrane protein [Cyclobacterium qasimii]